MRIFVGKRKNLSKILIGIFILIAFIVLLNFFQKEVRSFFYNMSSPIQKVFWQTGNGVSDFFNSLIKMRGLKRKTDELNLQNQELLAEIARLKEIRKENDILRQALGMELQKDFKLLLARIIGKDISEDSLLIDRGYKDGVSENMPVITPGKVLVGRINEVYKNFSKVMLISNKKSVFDAKIQTGCLAACNSEGIKQEKDISGLIKGQGNFKIIFDLVPRDKEISRGDVVVSSSLGEVFPAGILIGQVAETQKTDVEPFQQIEVKPSFDVTELTTLFLIAEYNHEF